MINVKICKNVKSAETKLMFNLTGRQLLCVIMAAAASIGTFLLLKPFLSIEAIFVVITLVCVPFVAFGFVTYEGMSFGKLLHIILFDNLMAEANLKYKTENFYKASNDIAIPFEEKTDEEVADEVEDKPKQKKKKTKKPKYKKSKLAYK